MSRTLAALALLAIAVRALVPAGYMLATAQDGRFIAVTLCSGHGAVDAVIDLTTGAVVDADATKQNDIPSNAPNPDAPCVFATMAALSAPEHPPAFTLVFQSAPAERVRDLAVAPGRGLAAPPPWSTGPPLAI